MIDRLISFARNEAVLCIAFLCALVSAWFVPPSFSYLAYIDTHVLVLLFCLMAAVAGLRECGLLSWCAQRLIAGERSMRTLAFVLVMIPFFASMLLTNDVALLAFVPFAAAALTLARRIDAMARIIVLQAIAANLGGMVTPLGNPQNLFIYSKYSLALPDFFAALLPFAALTFVMLTLCCLMFGRERAATALTLDETRIRKKRFAFYGVLFGLCLLAVVRVLPSAVLLGITLAALALFDRRMFARVDYGLLATFVCFFVFSGNMASIPAVHDFLSGLMNQHPLLTSVALSQVISNVPAAVLLSEFTTNWHSLLLGVDLGGLGTPIASLASLIALKMYLHTPNAKAGTFMKEFAIANAVGLAAMLGLYALLFVV